MIVAFLGLLVIICLLAFAFAPHPPKTPARAANAGELESDLERLVASRNPPGISVVVVKDGKIIYDRAFGYADRPRKIKAAPDTVYHWWSMTKIPTAIAILQLRDQGKLNLDDPVTKYLPWFQAVYPSTEQPAITVRRLLQHSSGIPDTMPSMIGWIHYDDQGRDQTEVARQYLSKFNKLKFEPGGRAVYSNYNYMLLGAIIESVGGDSYERYMTERVLKPLDMTSTAFVYSAEMTAHAAAGSLPLVHFYTPLLPFLLNTRALIREREANLLWFNKLYIDATPSTGLIGPARDVARLMAAYLQGGTLDGETILSRASVSELTKTPAIEGHGLGWFVLDQGARIYLEHAGGGPGFATNMRIYPDEGLGIALMANGTDLDRSGISDLIASMDWPS
ncbi:MAG TPA: serine hydrolase domain-containing protein [Anaerolineales bacterium]|nr:serine hydrolase domain-containing protein [Anaerolineales bacterium]